MNTRKGQTALEFLMTYGWAILVVLAAIGALAYFGVLNPTNFLPDQCLATSGFGCQGKPVIHMNNISITLNTNVGAPVNYTAIRYVTSIAGDSCTTWRVCDKGNIGCTASTSYYAVEGAEASFTLSGCTFTQNSIKGDMQIDYLNSRSGLVETVVVTISGRKR